MKLFKLADKKLRHRDLAMWFSEVGSNTVLYSFSLTFLFLMFSISANIKGKSTEYGFTIFLAVCFSFFLYYFYLRYKYYKDFEIKLINYFEGFDMDYVDLLKESYLYGNKMTFYKDEDKLKFIKKHFEIELKKYKDSLGIELSNLSIGKNK